jgi:hypothetical protein
MRKMWDQIVSGAGAVVAVVLLMLGAVAIYGGTFGQDNVRDRLAPQNVTFPPLEAMTPEEKTLVGDFAGTKVVDGPGAEAFSDYIGLHLEETNEGKTYSETSSMARAEGLSEKEAAELSGMADSLFKGETLRAMLLNAYGWWTVSSLVIFAGYGLLAAGALLALLAILGFFHARKVEPKTAAIPVTSAATA